MNRMTVISQLEGYDYNDHNPLIVKSRSAAVAAAKADGALLLTFAQLIADLERLPARPIR
jgi:hypothetical protein